jgi:hypothetical protein
MKSNNSIKDASTNTETPPPAAAWEAAMECVQAKTYLQGDPEPMANPGGPYLLGHREVDVKHALAHIEAADRRAREAHAEYRRVRTHLEEHVFPLACNEEATRGEIVNAIRELYDSMRPWGQEEA